MTTITPPITPGRTRRVVGSRESVEMDPRIKARREAVHQEYQRERAQGWLFMLGFVLVVLVAIAALRSPLFDVETISVEGASQPETIIAAAGIDYGTPLINADVDTARRAIAALPMVEAVTSRRSWNGQVTFTIVERLPAAQFVNSDGTVRVADVEGRVIALHDQPLVGTVEVAGLDLGASPGQWLDEQGLGIVRAAATVPDDLLTATNHLTADGGGLSLELQTGAIVLIGADRELEAKYDALRAFLARSDLLRCMEQLDLRAPSVPVLTRDRGCA